MRRARVLLRSLARLFRDSKFNPEKVAAVLKFPVPTH